jgi:hypothetical protein
VVDPWDEWEDVFGGLDPDTDAELFQVAVDRQMTLEIGLAVRCHVRLDQTLHLTATTLTGAAMSPGTSTSKLIGRIERAITAKPLPGPTANEKALEALSAARLANQHRNRVLHDNWMAVFDDDGPRLERIRTDVPGVENVGINITPTPDTLSSIAAVSSELTAVYYRILGIFLYAQLSNGLTPSEVETECETALSLISGVDRE